MSLTKASSRFDESSCTSRAVTPAEARARTTALTSSPVPVTTTRAPSRSTLCHLGKLPQQPVIERGRGQEPHALPTLGLHGQAGRGIQRDDASVVDQRHAVAQPFGFLHEVGHQQDRHPAVAHALDELPGVAAGLRVKPGRHLVEHCDLRPAGRRPRPAFRRSCGDVRSQPLACSRPARPADAGLHDLQVAPASRRLAVALPGTPMTASLSACHSTGRAACFPPRWRSLLTKN